MTNDDIQPDYFNVRACITALQNNQDRPVWYTACPTDTCKRKVTEQGPSQYWCQQCSKNYDHCEYRYGICSYVFMTVRRYILSFAAADHTGNQWLNSFDDVAASILGYVLLGAKAVQIILNIF